MDLMSIAPDGGEQLRFLGDSTMRLKLATPELAFYEYVAPPGAVGPPQHVHHGHDETFFIADGHFEFVLADTVIDAPAGTFLEVPRGIAHTFRNAGDANGTIVGTFTPGRFANYFRELAAVIERTGCPPGTTEWTALYAKYDTTFR